VFADFGNKYKVWNDTWNKWEILEFENEYSNTGSIYFKTNTGNIGVNKKYYLKNKWIKPYKEEINELEVENPNKDWKRVWAMYCYLRQDYHWDELYEKVFKKYDNDPKYNLKYNLKGGSIPSFVKNLSQQDLNKLYKELKQLDTHGK
jgi:hypothetical protein